MAPSRPPQPLWGRETELALANFDVSGQPLPIEIVHALAAIKAEAALVNAELRAEVDDDRKFAAIRDAALSVQRGEHDEQFLIDIFQTGSGTSTNMNVNEVVARLASDASGLAIHPNDDVNASQSSNDVFPTAVTLAAVIAIAHDLLPAVAQLTASLDGAAARFATIVKAGRTHLMDAVPIFLGDEFAGYASQLREARERIETSLPRVGRVPLGGTAVGTGLNAPAEFGERVVSRLAAQFGVPLSIAPSRFAAQASRDSIVEASSHLRTLAIALMKIANDVRLMASGPATGLAELRLPELQAGSSIMPGKVNPVMSEMVTQVAVQVFGNDAAIGLAGSQGAFELNTYQPMMGANVLSSIKLLTRACVLFAEKCVDGTEADVERNRHNAQSTPALATGLNERLGYDHVAKIVKKAIAERRPLIDVVVEDGALDRQTAEDLLDAERAARGNRGQTQGTSPKGHDKAGTT
jgi:fumarate hydratase, class II